MNVEMSPNLSIKFKYPDLPVVAKRETFLDLLLKCQVIIVQADTGSGKSTQLPKFLLESGLAKKGKIGVTQPRRLAALSIADRLREELEDETLVSSKIRFFEEGPSDAPLKVMTDGILLQEFRRDRLFSSYSAIMIDEAHERSLNIDILLGIFKQVLKQRPLFRLIIASATMDASLFKDFFDDSEVLFAEGRTFPVQVEYRDPLEGECTSKGDCGVLEEALEAIVDLETQEPDHLLCFLPTERDISDLAEMLTKEFGEESADIRFEILPLFGRMSPAEQKRIFKNSSKIKIVLATNIAETSLTIPGIAYVVDSGMARISRYNAAARIQGLPIEKVSQASAKQRTGRAGRVKPGFCIRLYAESDFAEREVFTEPEIRRSNLANVVLQLRSLDLTIESFEFLQSPLRSAFRGAYRTLFELGALASGDSASTVTKFGRDMARLPMDVTLAAVLLRAREKNVLQPALIVCAALSIQDPRVTPPDDVEKEKARVIHRKFGGHKSDFLTYLSLWNAFCSELASGSSSSWNKLRKFCEKNYLHFLRCREWIDLYEQYARLLKVSFESRVCEIKQFNTDDLHIALLYGFLGGIAKKDAENNAYHLIGGREAYVFPGSDLIGKKAEWVLSTEVRETSRVYLCKNVEIRPDWILQAAAPFCTKRWFEPAWNRDRGFVEAVEEVSFRGLVIFRGRRVDYAHINPEECASIFFREAIVNEDIARPFPFMAHNAKILQSLEALEARERRYGLVPNEEIQIDFYAHAAPGVHSIKTLKDFIYKNSDKALRFQLSDFLEERDSLFTLPQSSLTHKMDFTKKGENQKSKDKTDAPEFGGSVEYIRLQNRLVRAELVFDSNRKEDGITLFMPAEMLSEFSPARFTLEMDKYRAWILDALFAGFSRDFYKKTLPFREYLDDAFCEALEKNLDASPVQALAMAVQKSEYFKNVPWGINPEKEPHLNLHLQILHSDGKKERVEISPEWGAFHYLQALKHLVPTEISDLPFGKYRYSHLNFDTSSACITEVAEANFYRDLRNRLKQKPRTELKEQAADRLSFLETGGAKAAANCAATPREVVLQSLICSSWDSNQAVRFSGIEFSKGNRVRSFADLAPKYQSKDFLLRFGLTRLCWESALLGGEMFNAAWNTLKEAVQTIRNGRSVAGNLEKTAHEVLEARSVYEILCLATRTFSIVAELPPSDSNPLAVSEEFSAKALREKFRPFLQASFLRENELKQIREVLQILEKSKSESAVCGNYASACLNACLLYEKFSALRLRRGIQESSESIDASDLEKLKMRFKKI